MGINNSSELSDVFENVMVQGSVTITTTQTELKVGANPEPARELVRVYNKSNTIIYVGPTGVTSSTGEPVERDQYMELPLGSGLRLYAITASGSANVTVWELG